MKLCRACTCSTSACALVLLVHLCGIMAPYPFQVATLVNYATNLAVSGSFLSLLGAVGIGGLCLIYAAIGIVGGAFIAFRLPETKGASLEEVQGILLRSKGVCAPCCCPSSDAVARHGHYAPVGGYDDEDNNDDDDNDDDDDGGGGGNNCDD
jgi:hypothetical protein